MAAQTADAPVDKAAHLELIRAAIRRGGPMTLGRVVLPDTVYGAASPLHEHLNAWHLAEADRDPGAREAVAAPRGHGKSTAGVELGALWQVAHCTRKFVVIVSDTWSQARDRVQAISQAIENEPLLTALYPGLRPKLDERGQTAGWRDDDLTFACGCRILGAGAGKAIRGAKQGATRPDLLLLDDLEDEDSVATAGAIEKRWRWLTRAALALGSPIRGLSALWVGTILSRSALLNLATGAALDPGQQRPKWAKAWRPAVYRAEVDGTPRVEITVDVEDLETGGTFTYTRTVGEPMWSELTREDLARIAGQVGDDAYAAEYQADPASARGILARPRPAAFLNPDAAPLERLVRLDTGEILPVASMARAAFLDPQYGDDGSADPDLGACAVVGQAGARTFLLDAWTGRDRHGQARIAVDLAVAWGCGILGVEANAAQVLTADTAAVDGRVPVAPVTSSRDKITRATSLSVRLGDPERPETSRVWAVDGPSRAATGHGFTTGVAALLPHLADFPGGRYDDPVDAVTGALALAVNLPQPEAAALPQLGGARAT